MDQIESMSDSDLRQTLKEYGMDVGPVTNTTRSVYCKKLEKLITSSHITEQHVVEATFEEAVVLGQSKDEESYVEQSSQVIEQTSPIILQTSEVENLMATPHVVKHIPYRDEEDLSETQSSNSSMTNQYYPRHYTPSDKNLKRRPLSQRYDNVAAPTITHKKVVITDYTDGGKVKSKQSNGWWFCKILIPLFILVVLLCMIVYYHMEINDVVKLPAGSQNKDKKM